MQLETNIGGVRAEPFLNAFVGAAPVTGALDTTLAIDTAGQTLDDWLGALNGRLAATFAEGAVEGINLAQRLRVAQAKLTGDEVDEAAEVRRTDFSVLRFAAEIRDGVVHAKELDLRAPLLRVSGDGRLDLGTRDLDYTARVLVTGTLKGQGGAAAGDLRGLEVPIRLTGPVTGPDIDVQLAKAFERRETAEARAKKEAAEQEARERREAAEAAAEEERREAEAKAKAELEEEKKRLQQEKKQKKEEAKEKLEQELEGLFN
jgi:AsmA protein